MIGDRLKIARKKSGYSLRGLSDAIDNMVSAQAIGKYERNEMMPTGDTLRAMAEKLEVTPEYLLHNWVKGLQGVEFRKNSGTSTRDRAHVEATVIEAVERYLIVEEALDLDSADWQVSFKPPRLNTLDDAEKLAEELRKEWRLGEDPVPNMTELLEEKGIKVLLLDLPDRVSGLTCLADRGPDYKLVPVIVVNKHFSLERRRFTLAHELAHRLIDDASEVDHEKASDVFAGAFLMHSRHLKAEIGKHRNRISLPELLELKQMYRVSAAALLNRFKQVGILSENATDRAFKTFAKTWKKEEPAPIEKPEKRGRYERPKRFTRLCYRALSEGLISTAKAAELLLMSYSQLDEIMRSKEAIYENRSS